MERERVELVGGEAPSAHYCLSCLAPVEEFQPQCSGCGTSFHGAGRFHRIEGTPPSRESVFRFDRAA